jgi:hypothetical protein
MSGVGVGICIVCHCVCVVLTLGHAKVSFGVFVTHKSRHLCKCGVGVGICIVCHCVCVVLGLGHAQVGFCVFGTHKSGQLCVCYWGWEKHNLPLCMCGSGARTCKSGLLCIRDTQKWTFVYVWC